jgi:hypothetical protein
MPLQAGRAPPYNDQGQPTFTNRLSAWIGIATGGGESEGWTTDQAVGDATGVPYPTTTPRNAYASDDGTQQRRRGTPSNAVLGQLGYLGSSQSSGRSIR